MIAHCGHSRLSQVVLHCAAAVHGVAEHQHLALLAQTGCDHLEVEAAEDVSVDGALAGESKCELLGPTLWPSIETRLWLTLNKFRMAPSFRVRAVI
jgi:hypothetical protein